jgi:hypothetical protein
VDSSGTLSPFIDRSQDQSQYHAKIATSTDDPIRIVVPSSGQSHQQDELSPVNEVYVSEGPLLISCRS